MKSYFIFCAGIFLCLILSFCSDDVQSNRNVSDVGIEQWEKELIFLLESTKKEQTGIQLISYQKQGVISKEDIPSLVENFFSDDADYVFYLDNRYSKYRIAPLGEQRNRLGILSQQDVPAPNYENEFNKLKTRLQNEIQAGMRLVSLTWRFNGESYHSLAVASATEGILYDNIGHFIIKPIEDDELEIQQGEINMSSIVPVTKTGEELPSPLIARFITSGSNTDIYGHVVYEYTLRCNSSFDSSGLFVGKQFFIHAASVPGWNCIASIQTTFGDPYESYQHDFAWAYACGETNVWIQWNGSDYITSGQHAASSTESHTLASVEQ